MRPSPPPLLRLALLDRQLRCGSGLVAFARDLWQRLLLVRAR